jgi:hypothetical protein
MRYTVRGGDLSVLLELDIPEGMVQLATVSRRVEDQAAICQDEGGNVEWA